MTFPEVDSWLADVRDAGLLLVVGVLVTLVAHGLIMWIARKMGAYDARVAKANWIRERRLRGWTNGTIRSKWL